MRDLKNQYVRANTCIACHQTVEIPLLKAGHPELIFELDGQAVSEPKHWRESTNWSGAQVWLVGQAVALREISWQVNTNNPFDEKLTARWQASLWLMRKMSVLLSAEGAPLFSAPDKADAVCKDADKLARDFAGMLWTAELSHKVLGRLAATGTDFQESGVPAASQARRAERLVLGLDRLAEELELKSKNSKADAALERLFGLAQSIPDFDPRKFSLALQEFSAALNEK
jgi:hypothetical protein